MGLRINTNVASLRAQNALRDSTNKLNVSLTRLSTGLRINTGQDDVVGLAKSEALRSQIRGIDQSKANIANVRGVLGVGEGYLSQLTEIAQQLRETAVQAADGTISAADRTSLTTKYTSLINEYNRLADNANFNGVSLLDGTFTSKSVQVGPDQGDTITINISDARSATIGQVAIYTAQVSSAASTNATASANFTDPSAITVNGVTVPTSAYTSDGVSTIEADESAIAYVNAINSVSGSSGVTATVLSNVATLDYGYSVGLSSSQHLLVNGVTVKSTTLSISDSDDNDASQLVDLINDQTSATGVVATIDTSNNKILLTAQDGRNINVQVTAKSTGSESSFNSFNMTGAATNAQNTFRGSFIITADAAFSVVGANNMFTSNATESVSLSSSLSLSNSSLSTTTNAGLALMTLDNVIAQLQSRRADIGSILNRFDIAERELGARSENISAAETAIRETDVAAETARLTQFQILQQAGVTVLAQANAAPQIALTLLQNL